MRSGTSGSMLITTSPTTVMAAAIQNTSCTASAKPAWNGAASAGSSPEMNEESLSTPVPSSTGVPPAARVSCAAASWSTTAALAGSASTSGSWMAARNAGSANASANRAAIRSPTVPNRIDRNTAVPSVPPICRKKVAELVATPMSVAGTAFCTARTIGCRFPPRPRPNTTITTDVCHSGVVAVIWAKRTSATTSRAVPTTGKTLYRPVREIS